MAILNKNEWVLKSFDTRVDDKGTDKAQVILSYENGDSLLIECRIHQLRQLADSFEKAIKLYEEAQKKAI